MENTYNAKLIFKGEGSFTFTLPNYGDLTIYNGRDIYVKGLSVNGVETLRQLRALMLDHILNAKPDGCYKVIDLQENVKPTLSKFERAYKEPKASISDLKAELIKSEGPIPVEETNTLENDLEEVKTEILAETKKPESKKPESKKTSSRRTSRKK